FAEDDSIGTHTQRIANQVALRDFGGPFGILRTGLQLHNVLPLQIEFRRIFDRHQTFVGRDVARQDIQQSRFTATGTTADHEVYAAFDGCFQNLHNFRTDRAADEDVVNLQRTMSEAAN